MRRNATGRHGPSTTSENDYVIRIFDDPGAIDADAWNALVEAQASAMPFMRHEYLLALHRSASAVESTGWQAQFLAVFADEPLAVADYVAVFDTEDLSAVTDLDALPPDRVRVATAAFFGDVRLIDNRALFPH